MSKSALIQCPSCNHQVSTQAVSCPQCGAHLIKPTRGFFGKVFAGLFWLWNIIIGVSFGPVVIAGLTGGGDNDASTAAIGGAAGFMMWVIPAAILALCMYFTRPRVRV